MESTDQKRLIIVAAIVVGFFGLSSYFLSWKTEVVEDSNAGFNYEMIRPEEEVGQFDLSGREIDRHILNDNEPEPGNSDGHVVNVAGSGSRNSGKPGKTGKPGNKTAKKNNAPGAIAGGANNGTNAKAKVSVRVVGEESNKKLGDLTEKAPVKNNNPNEPVVTGPTVSEPMPITDVKKTDTEEDVDKDIKMTEDEWKKLLADRLDGTLATKIVKAHDKGYLPDTAFYPLVFEVLKSNRPQARPWAFAVLTHDNSVRSFEYMATEYSKLPEDIRAELWKVMVSYRQSNKFLPLAQALHVKDKGVVSYALQVLTLAVEDQKKRIETSTQESNTSSQGNRSVAGQVTSQYFNVFLSGLNQIGQANDTTLSPTAQGLSADIQKFNKT